MTKPDQHPVTDTVGSAMSDDTRNATIEAELRAEEAERQAWKEANPESAARIDAIAEGLREALGTASDEMFPSAWKRKWSAYECEECGHAFAEGDVVYRRRRTFDNAPFGMSWRIATSCLDCAAKWHPSWMEHRREAVECEGGCGVLVTSAYMWNRPTTCSTRCSEIVAASKRRAVHDDRECVECEQPFTPTRSDALYCSTACRMKAYRRRRKPEMKWKKQEREDIHLRASYTSGPFTIRKMTPRGHMTIGGWSGGRWELSKDGEVISHSPRRTYFPTLRDAKAAAEAQA